MNSQRYKAYLSYSHADRRWASWLHRALESYRVPRALRGKRADGKVIPARVAPVFRDRDDLSSSSRLDEELHRALEASEFLVVVCSPAAADSRWVNEEIRAFRTLGRADRILCFIVDGDPNQPVGEGGCFPPALFGEESFEPLAADPRPAGDGRALARLKIVSGLLGLQLDELRQRERRRRRHRVALGVVAGVAAVALVGWSVLSGIQQRHAREKAESLANLIVDLGEDIKDEVSLEVQERIGRISLEYLADLDPLDLSPETSISVGRAIRGIGEAQQGQGRAEEAEDAFLEVRSLFETLSEKYPDNPELRFELAQSEYSLAYLHYTRGEYEAAWPSARRYDALARSLTQRNPENDRWKLEASYAATGVLAMQLTSGEVPPAALFGQANEAVHLAEELFESDPDDPKYISNYSTTLAWSSDAQAAFCALDNALRGRETTLELARRALEAEPSNRSLEQRVAFRLSGVAHVSSDLGQYEESERYREEAIAILERLVREDPGNVKWQSDLQWQRLSLAELMLVQRRYAEFNELFETLSLPAQEGGPETGTRDDMESHGWHDLMLAEYLAQTGSTQGMQDHLLRSLGATARLAAMEGGLGVLGRAFRSRALYLWWRMGQGPAPVETLMTVERSPGDQPRHCTDALSNARLALVMGSDAIVDEELRYLKSQNFASPGLRLFCESSGRCEP